MIGSSSAAEARRPPGASGKVVRLDLWGGRHNVNLQIEDISEKMARNIPGLLTDLLEVATYVYCADQATTRGGNNARNMGKDWRRRFRFLIPVRNPDVWNAPDVRDVAPADGLEPPT